MDLRHDISQDNQSPHFSLHPSLEDVMEMLDVISQQDVGLDEIAQAMETKTHIASVVIRTANSVGLGAVREVRSLRHAVALMGLKRIRQILLEMKAYAATDHPRIAG